MIWLDTAVTLSSFLSKWLLVRKDRRGWVITFFVNIVFVYIFWTSERLALIPMSIGYGFMSVYGWWTWGKERKCANCNGEKTVWYRTVDGFKHFAVCPACTGVGS